MHALTRTPTTEMEVTSIRLERELKEKLKELSGNQGYQALIRDVLWDYVQQRNCDRGPILASTEIRATVSAIAHQEQQCALTGQVIQPNEPMLLGVTPTGTMVPIRLDSFVSPP